MSHPPPDARRAQAFRALYEANRPDVLRFVQRRTSVDRADDVVAEVFLVVWRRLDSAPTGHDVRPWIFGIARNLMLNERRGQERRRALEVRLADPVSSAHARDHADGVVDLVDLARAWRLLGDVHQEALALAVLDDLDAPRAAAVLGISPVAFRLRLSRARRALRAHLGHRTQHDQPVPAIERNLP
jgi:RNA polymerase sigma-70 factor (ECF subfamily)